MRYATLSLLLLSAVCALPAAAQTAVKQTHPLARGGRVEIENIAGQVRVRGWDRDEVSLTGTLGPGQRLDVNESADRLQFEVIYPRSSRNGNGAQLELRAPRGAVLQAEVVSAGLDVDQIDLARLQPSRSAARWWPPGAPRKRVWSRSAAMCAAPWPPRV